jgi:hypothetical protein
MSLRPVTLNVQEHEPIGIAAPVAHAVVFNVADEYVKVALIKLCTVRHLVVTDPLSV